VRPGNSLTINYTDGSGTARTVTVLRVDDPSALPLQGTSTPNANDTVVGVDFSGGILSVVAQLNSALGISGLQFSNSGGMLRLLDDGGVGNIDISNFSAKATQTSLTGGGPELPFFTDGTSPYTGAITGQGSQSLGFAGRIEVNRALLADPSRVVVYQTSPLTPSGDTTRPNFLYDQLTKATLDYAPQAGVGTALSPFSGPLPSYMRQVVSQQGEAASAAESLALGQEIVFNSLTQRQADGSAVNIDEEMASLLNLQNQYGANARVMSTIKEMLDLLMQM
jgi:flagellar hook-associated protein 1